MQKNILKKSWICILRKMKLFIKIHVLPLNKIEQLKGRINISWTLFGPSCSQFRFQKFFQGKLFYLQLNLLIEYLPRFSSFKYLTKLYSNHFLPLNFHLFYLPKSLVIHPLFTYKNYHKSKLDLKIIKYTYQVFIKPKGI